VQGGEKTTGFNPPKGGKKEKAITSIQCKKISPKWIQDVNHWGGERESQQCARGEGAHAYSPRKKSQESFGEWTKRENKFSDPSGGEGKGKLTAMPDGELKMRKEKLSPTTTRGWRNSFSKTRNRTGEQL